MELRKVITSQHTEEQPEWNAEKGYLFIHLNLHSNNFQYRDNLNHYKEVLLKHNGNKIIIEINNYTKLSLEDQFYTSYIFIPDLIKHGVKKMAILASTNMLLRKLFVDSLNGSREGKLLQFETFSDIEQAESWLSAN
jgi:hypothetical protein